MSAEIRVWRDGDGVLVVMCLDGFRGFLEVADSAVARPLHALLDACEHLEGAATEGETIRLSDGYLEGWTRGKAPQLCRCGAASAESKRS